MILTEKQFAEIETEVTLRPAYVCRISGSTVLPLLESHRELQAEVERLENDVQYEREMGREFLAELNRIKHGMF